ncbi:helix-turn-helix domain-containing protein [Cupriavidus pauculus]|uniref:Transcriptional regulator n=1 Tax=Cupriavidus pauculus TaxID=82633 RepID=A0A2N5C8D3_9BURK|nr:transcriptional regulator [Cupriavidus pauculus]
MRYTIKKASDIGGVIRAARKGQCLRQDDAAGSVGVSLSFINKAEGGAESVQWGKLFQILEGLGVTVTFDIPDASEELLRIQSQNALHRAAARDFRTAERLIASEPGKKAASTTTSSKGSADKASTAKAALVLHAAERLLATQPPKNSRAGMTLKRAQQLLQSHEGPDHKKRLKKATDK